eukprot:TRINITY_DN900_c0_g2_i1.p1 TRINITY_DN900_c0_g2~~TRINITY_DN900_c0_g2_i1.p1  ORF type:complete len:486 (+),score=160.83 TRINITY_DN900_c0_g2_i1:177-1634(+)
MTAEGGADGWCPEAPQDWEAHVNAVKLKARSDLKLSGWAKYKFGTKRAAAVEAAARRMVGAAEVPYLDVRENSAEEFFALEQEGRVVMLRGVPEGWKAFDWSFKNLCETFPDERFRVGEDSCGRSLRLPMKEFMAYCHRQADDSPLYIFDSNMGGSSVCPVLAEHYSPPSFFPDDLMAHSSDRPPYKWLVCGPKRSGSTCHIDPLDTSAWNTLLVGRKKWAIIPPDVPADVARGRTVMRSGDDDEAVHFFVDLIPRMRARGVPVVETVQEAGETIFVPGGWWHCVLNITDTVAVTQNYCGRYNFAGVWRSARSERPCWAYKWLKGLQKHAPDWAERAERLNKEDGHDMHALLAVQAARRKERLERRVAKAKAKARKKARRTSLAAFDEGAWERTYRAKVNYASDSTVSTTSPQSSSSSGEEGAQIVRGAKTLGALTRPELQTQAKRRKIDTAYVKKHAQGRPLSQATKEGLVKAVVAWDRRAARS